MTPPITIIKLNAYAGPNIFGPSPGVLLHVRCDRDRSSRLRAAIKDGAQFIGLVIAHLTIEVRPADDGVEIMALFSTDAPTLGADLCTYVAEGITVETGENEEWDRDGPLFALQARRRAEALPVAALQLIAEARRRGLPTFVRADGYVQIGYGAHGWSFDPSPLHKREAQPPIPSWDNLGSIPIIAVTGHTERTASVQRFAAELATLGAATRSLDGATFDAIREVMADPAVEALVVGLDTADILRRGLPFDRCELAVVADRAGPRPPEAADDDEWLRALGVPMLLSPQPTRINLADSGLLPLVPYAPNGVVGL